MNTEPTKLPLPSLRESWANLFNYYRLYRQPDIGLSVIDSIKGAVLWSGLLNTRKPWLQRKAEVTVKTV